MVFGESFEEAAPAASLPRPQTLPSGAHSIASATNPNLRIRHCSFQLWATQPSSPYMDFHWTLVPALNGQPGAVSLESFNYPGYYVTVINGTGDTPTPRYVLLLLTVHHCRA